MAVSLSLVSPRVTLKSYLPTVYSWRIFPLCKLWKNSPYYRSNVNNLETSGVHWGAYAKNEVESIPKVWKALFELFESGKVKPALYHKVYQLSTIPQGMNAINNRETYAKVVATVDSRESKI